MHNALLLHCAAVNEECRPQVNFRAVLFVDALNELVLLFPDVLIDRLDRSSLSVNTHTGFSAAVHVTISCTLTLAPSEESLRQIDVRA